MFVENETRQSNGNAQGVAGNLDGAILPLEAIPARRTIRSKSATGNAWRRRDGWCTIANRPVNEIDLGVSAGGNV